MSAPPEGLAPAQAPHCLAPSRLHPGSFWRRCRRWVSCFCPHPHPGRVGEVLPGGVPDVRSRARGPGGPVGPGGGEQRTPGSHPCATDGGRVRAPALLRASLFISSHSGSPPGLPLVAMNRGCHCLRLRASLCGGFSPCGGRALSVSSAVAAPGFSCQTCVPCIGRRALNPWMSREAPLSAS